MKGPNAFRIFINASMNFLMSTGIALISMGIGSVQTGTMLITPSTLFNTVLVCFVVGYFVSDVLPIISWGERLAQTLGTSGKAHTLVVSAVLGACMGVFVCIGSGYILNYTGGIDAVLSFYAGNFLTIFLSAIVLACILFEPMQGVARRLTEFDPTAVEAEAEAEAAA